MHVISGPTYALIKRDLLVELRKGKTFYLLLALTVFTAGLLLVRWPRGDFVTWFDISRYAGSVVSSVGIAAFFGAALIVPGLSAASVVVDKEQGNWESLYLTLISRRGIVLGKILGSVAVYMVYVIALMPLLAVVFFVGGVDPGTFVYLFVLVLTTAATLGAIGVACSISSRRTDRAIAGSYIGMAWLMGAPMLILPGIARRLDMAWLDALVDNRGAIPSSLSTFLWIMDGSGIPPGVFFGHLLYQALLATLAVLWAIRALRKPAAPPIVPHAISAANRTAPAASLSAPPIPDTVNPVYARERRYGSPRGIFSRFASIAVVMCFWLIALIAFLTAAEDGMFEMAWYFCLMGQRALIWIVIPAMLCNLFTKDNHPAILEMLRLSPLTPKEIARGKMRAGARRVGVILLAGFSVNAVFAAVSGYAFLSPGEIPFLGGGESPLMGQLGIILDAVLLFMVTIYASIRSQRAGGAIVASYVIFFVLSTALSILPTMVMFYTMDFQNPSAPMFSITPWFAAKGLQCLAILGLYGGSIRLFTRKMNANK